MRRAALRFASAFVLEARQVDQGALVQPFADDLHAVASR